VIFKRGRSVNHEVPGWDLPLSRCVCAPRDWVSSTSNRGWYSN
jgi:hypothetical protein